MCRKKNLENLTPIYDQPVKQIQKIFIKIAMPKSFLDEVKSTKIVSLNGGKLKPSPQKLEIRQECILTIILEKDVKDPIIVKKK